MEHYSGTRLLSLMDIEKRKPEIYMASGNRTSGKTYYFKGMEVNRFLKKQQKFVILRRFKTQVKGTASYFFKDLQEIKYPGMKLEEDIYSKGLFSKLYLNGKHCGYTIPINMADDIRLISTEFVDADSIFLDEFQSENGVYVPNEIKKFQSIHVSIARGGGKSVRYVPCYLVSNMVSILNPYFVAFGIHKRINKNTKFMRGRGWVLEFNYNPDAAAALQNSGFGRAFENDNYMQFAAENVYLNDNEVFISKVPGEKQYAFTCFYKGQAYGVYKCYSAGVVYITDRPDLNCKNKYSFDIESHTEYTILKGACNMAQLYLREMFKNGKLRFKNVICKNAILDMLVK